MSVDKSTVVRIAKLACIRVRFLEVVNLNHNGKPDFTRRCRARFVADETGKMLSRCLVQVIDHERRRGHNGLHLSIEDIQLFQQELFGRLSVAYRMGYCPRERRIIR